MRSGIAPPDSLDLPARIALGDGNQVWTHALHSRDELTTGGAVCGRYRSGNLTSLTFTPDIEGVHFLAKIQKKPISNFFILFYFPVEQGYRIDSEKTASNIIKN